MRIDGVFCDLKEIWREMTTTTYEYIHIMTNQELSLTDATTHILRISGSLMSSPTALCMSSTWAILHSLP